MPDSDSLPLERLANTLLGMGCSESASVVKHLSATVRATGFVLPPRPLTKDERRAELERMACEGGGGRRIANIFDEAIHRDDREIFIPGSFVQAMIDQLLCKEFPSNAS